MDREQNEQRVTAAVDAMQRVLQNQQANLPDRYVEWIDLYELADAALIAADRLAVSDDESDGDWYNRANGLT